MAGIDFFCSPDDRHRVILLVDLLEKAGQAVALRCEPTDAPTRPCLVACTRRAFREPWINALFTVAGQVAALRLDDAPLPGPVARIIDMQAWPARSADRNVGPLVTWLQFGDEEVAGDRASAAVPPPHRAARRRDDGSSRRPVKRRFGDPNVVGGLTLLALLIAAGVLLVVTADPDRTAPPESDEPLAALARGSSSAGPPHAVRPEAGSADAAATAAMAVADATMSSAAALPATGEADTSGSTAGLPAGAPLTVAPPAPLERALRPPPAHPDALRHLCQARTVAAARAWAGALDWKQRGRLPNEPCVQHLLQRAGFQELVALLDLS